MTEHKNESGKGAIDSVIESCRSEARWQKAIQRRREDGDLLGAVQDIGPLIRSIQEDVVAEDLETIKAQLWSAIKADALRKSVAGFAEWYKECLARGEVKP